MSNAKSSSSSLGHFPSNKGSHNSGTVLDETRLRVVPDTLRLQPVKLEPGVLCAVLDALAQRCAIQVSYLDAKSKLSTPKLHPQALVQRGPIPYLIALKNDEEAPLRLYALHRMNKAEALVGTPTRKAKGFDLDQAIANGLVDFGHKDNRQTNTIDLVLRVRGYMTALLAACPLSQEPTFEKEPEGSGFDCQVRAKVLQTGQLFRWLIGAGNNIEVLEPTELRQSIAEHIAKMNSIYQSATVNS